MAEPQTVADCVSAMQAQVDIPVTVKSRIGIDDMDEYEDLSAFIEQVAEAGCDTFIVHARKAWLQGLSPKQNREVPPLMYERVYQLKEEFPHLHVSINGGVKTLAEAQHHLSYVDGVMIGREAYSNPYILSEVDHLIYGDNQAVLSRIEIVKRMHSYIVEQLAAPNQFGQGTKVWHIVRHMLGLFQGQPGGRVWRRYLSENAVGRNTSPDVLFAALDALLETQAASQAYLDSKVD
jgi:tRNA-dihydrouridine synthase A